MADSNQMKIYITIDGTLQNLDNVASTAKKFPIDHVMIFNMHSEDFKSLFRGNGTDNQQQRFRNFFDLNKNNHKTLASRIASIILNTFDDVDLNPKELKKSCSSNYTDTGSGSEIYSYFMESSLDFKDSDGNLINTNNVYTILEDSFSRIQNATYPDIDIWDYMKIGDSVILEGSFRVNTNTSDPVTYKNDDGSDYVMVGNNGNVPVILKFQVYNRNPTINSDLPDDDLLIFNEGATITYTFQAKDEDGDTTAALSILEGNEFITFANNVLTINPDYTKQGQLGTFRIIATDDKGAQSYIQKSYQVQNTNRNPEMLISLSGDQLIAENSIITFNLNISDPDIEDSNNLDITNVTIDGKNKDEDSKLTWNQTSATWNLSSVYNATGTHTLVVYFTDGEVNLSQSHDFTVIDVNRTPSTTSEFPVSFKLYEGQNTTSWIDATDGELSYIPLQRYITDLDIGQVPNNSLSIESVLLLDINDNIVSLPDWLLWSDRGTEYGLTFGENSPVSSLVDGHKLRVTIKDNTNDTNTNTLIKDISINVNDIPEITNNFTSGENVTILNEGQDYTISLSFDETSTVTNISLSPSIGEAFSWTSGSTFNLNLSGNYDVAGDYTLIVDVINGADNHAFTLTKALTILNVNRLPTLEVTDVTSITQLSLSEGSSKTVSYNFNDADTGDITTIKDIKLKDGNIAIWTKTNGGVTWFSVDEVNKTFTVNLSNEFDITEENEKTFSVEFTVSDSDGQVIALENDPSTTLSFPLIIQHYNRAPRFDLSSANLNTDTNESQDYIVEVDEDTSTWTSGEIVMNDDFGENTPTLSASINTTLSYAPSVSIVNSNQLQVSNINNGSAGDWVIVIRSTDALDSNLFVEKTILFRINNIDQLPTISFATEVQSGLPFFVTVNESDPDEIGLLADNDYELLRFDNTVQDYVSITDETQLSYFNHISAEPNKFYVANSLIKTNYRLKVRVVTQSKYTDVERTILRYTTIPWYRVDSNNIPENSRYVFFDFTVI